MVRPAPVLQADDAMAAEGAAFGLLFAEAPDAGEHPPGTVEPLVAEDDSLALPPQAMLPLWPHPLPTPVLPTTPTAAPAEGVLLAEDPALAPSVPNAALAPLPQPVQPPAWFDPNPALTQGTLSDPAAQIMVPDASNATLLAEQPPPSTAPTQQLPPQDAAAPTMAATQPVPPVLSQPTTPPEDTPAPSLAAHLTAKPHRRESPAERAFMVQTAQPLADSPPLQPDPPPAADPVQQPPFANTTKPENRDAPAPLRAGDTAPMPAQGNPTTDSAPPAIAQNAVTAPGQPPETTLSGPTQPTVAVTQWGIDTAAHDRQPDLPPLETTPADTPFTPGATAPLAAIIPPPLHQITATPLPTPMLPDPTPKPLAPTLAKIARDTSTGAVELSLAPAELGRLHMAITQDGDQVRVTLTAERPETLELLRRNADQLAQEFRQAGFAGSSLSFGQWGSGHPPPQQPGPDPIATANATPAFVAPAQAPQRGAVSGGTGLDLRL